MTEVGNCEGQKFVKSVEVSHDGGGNTFELVCACVSGMEDFQSNSY
jgi:hypothetical protein